MSTDDLRIRQLITTKAERDRRERTYERHGTEARPCVRCGRQTDGSLFVVVVDGYASIVHPDDAADALDAEPEGYMGCYPIGPTCAKTLPEGFVEEAR